MRLRFLLLSPALVVAACSSGTTASSLVDLTSIVPDYANSAAASLDAGGIGGSQFPDSLALTTDQKAAIEALHAAFKTSTAADVAALQALDAQARAAKQAGKSADEIRAIIAQGAPIIARMSAAFTKLQSDINAIYTTAQKAWLASHQPRPCGAGGPPTLTDAQKASIKSLQDAFTAAVANDVAAIRAAADSAHHAEAAGATRDQVQAILHSADAAQARVRTAERKLQSDIEAILTNDQRNGRCQSQGMPHP